MRAGGVAMLLVLGVAVACGGKTSFLDTDPNADAAGSAGATSRGGRASTGGRTSRGGSSSAAGTLSLDVGGSASMLGGDEHGWLANLRL